MSELNTRNIEDMMAKKIQALIGQTVWLNGEQKIVGVARTCGVANRVIGEVTDTALGYRLDNLTLMLYLKEV